MRQLNFKLRVMVPENPDLSEIEPESIEEYVGGLVNQVEHIISDQLPEGWYARIEDGNG